MVMSDGDATGTTSHVEKQSFRITRIDYINLLTVNNSTHLDSLFHQTLRCVKEMANTKL